MFPLSYGNMSGSLRVLPEFLYSVMINGFQPISALIKYLVYFLKLIVLLIFFFQPGSKTLPISTHPSTSLPCPTFPRPALPCSALPCSTLPCTSLPCTSLPKREEMIFFQSDFTSVTWFVKGFRLQYIRLIPQV